MVFSAIFTWDSPCYSAIMTIICLCYPCCGVCGLHGVLMRTVRKIQEEYDKGLEYFHSSITKSLFLYTTFYLIWFSHLSLAAIVYFSFISGWEFDLNHLGCLYTLLVFWEIFQFKFYGDSDGKLTLTIPYSLTEVGRREKPIIYKVFKMENQVENTNSSVDNFICKIIYWNCTSLYHENWFPCRMG